MGASEISRFSFAKKYLMTLFWFSLQQIQFSSDGTENKIGMCDAIGCCLCEVVEHTPRNQEVVGLNPAGS